LTIWRWGRLNPVKSGLPIGGFEQWADWCRSPFVALGCCDPVRRIEAIKSEDPARRNIAELFACWDAHHSDRLLQAADLADPVCALIDPLRREHKVAARLTALAGTRAGGFVLAQHIDPSRGVSTYRLQRSASTGEKGGGGRADASEMSAKTSTQVRAVPSIDGPKMFEERAHDEATDLGRESLGESRITIELERGQYVHVNRDFDAVALARVLDVLARAR
jgi:hypothetical protein